MPSSRTLSSTILYAGALALAALAALLAASPANAAFPGENGRIAFHDDDGGEADSEIFTINPDGSDRQQLTTNGLDDLEPAWSPDGTRIVFYRVVPGGDFGPDTAEIWVMNADGSDQVRITTGSFGEEDDPSFDSEPAFSGDGTRVVFTRQPVGDVGDGDSEIWIMNADGSGQTQLTDNFVTDIEPTINPASTLIAFSQEFFAEPELAAPRRLTGIDMDIVTTDLSGGNFRIVTATGEYDDEAPNFSPDGSTIAFARCQLGTDQQGFTFCLDDGDIASVPTNGDEDDVTLLTGGGEEDFDADEDPAYSPDGTQMVFSRLFNEPVRAGVEPRTPASGSSLQLAAFSGGASSPLTIGFNGDWQPIQPAGTPGTPGTSGTPGTPGETDLGTCRGHDVTIAGTPASEKIVGTPGDDVIKGRKGNDRIKGLGGDDYICGQRGRDKLFGNAGDDILIGGQSRDFLKGGPGKDRMFGGTPGAPDDPVPNTCVGGTGDRSSNCKLK